MIRFRPFTSTDRSACLGLFDTNAPEYFDFDERVDYERFLDNLPARYWVCTREEEVLAAFGFIMDGERGRIQWIMVGSNAQGIGIGGLMMRRIRNEAHESGVRFIDIAASQKSAPFFAHYGAEVRMRTEEGWGRGLDRIDMELDLTTVSNEG